MRNKIIMAIVVLCCSFNSSKAQTNNIYAEFLGVGLLGSINYERMVKDNIFARVSYGGFSVESESFDDDYYYYGTSTSKMSINPLSLGAHYLRGNKWKLEAGAGITYWMISFGFRYQNPEGGLNLKVGVSPIVVSVDGETGTLAWPHIGLGYAF